MKRMSSILTCSVLAGFVLAGCQSSRSPQTSMMQPSAAPAERPVSVAPVVLAEGVLPPGNADPRAWVADEVTLAQQRPVKHSHEAGFVYAPVTPSRLTIGGETKTLRPGEAVFIGDNVAHTHDVTCTVPTDCRDSFWEIRLTRPGTKPAAGDEKTKRIFESPTFTASSADAATRLRFELLQVPPGAVVPLSAAGTRYLYVPRGGIAGKALSGSDRLLPREGLLALPQTPVTARNEGHTPVAVLVWHAAR